MATNNKNKASCDRLNKIIKSCESGKCIRRPKKVVLSKKLANCTESGKSCSTGVISNLPGNKPKKYTKSDACFSTKNRKSKSLGICEKCGDDLPKNHASTGVRNYQSVDTYKKSYLPPKIQYGGNNGKPDSSKCGVKQYYKNENFKSTESIQEIEEDLRKISLDTIKEVPEMQSEEIDTAVNNVYEIYSDSAEEIGFLDTNDREIIDDLKKFRKDNYFECHSVKSRIDLKPSATNLVDHKCVYRFYLNDRLFPIPISTDHCDNIRCVECHLPIDLNNSNDKANGTIQAKVKMGDDDDAQDMIFLLPVKDTLIVKERRKQISKEEEVLYFGVVKLDTYGHSVFNSTLPSDSLALKYQKGYREHRNEDGCRYKGVENDDLIII